MPAVRPHPNRCATTLATRVPPEAGGGPYEPPGAGSADARVDLKLLLFRARRALETRGTDAARARFRSVDEPDLLAGTVQDGVARGVAVALEEVVALCDGPEPPPPEDEPDEDGAERFEGRDLRRKKDILVASGGARIRWSRRGGILFVDRDHDVHEEDCIRFEDRRDLGDLDGFAGDPDERPRLFSPAFLRPVVLVHGARRHRLVLEGRLGRRADGYDCRIVFQGDSGESFVRMVVIVRNDRDDHRLRVRFIGCRDPRAIDSDGTPAFSTVRYRSRWFVAATLVRACGRLRVGDREVAVPGAQCHGTHRHEFRLGGRPWRDGEAEASGHA